MSVSQRSPEERELEALSRRYAGLVHQVRLEALDERLARVGPRRVRFNRCGLSGDRWTIYFDDGDQLRLKLYWPQSAAICAVCSVRWLWNKEWRVAVRERDGHSLDLHAYHAELHPRWALYTPAY